MAASKFHLQFQIKPMITVIKKENLSTRNYTRHLESNIYHVHMMLCYWSLKESLPIHVLFKWSLRSKFNKQEHHPEFHGWVLWFLTFSVRLVLPNITFQLHWRLVKYWTDGQLSNQRLKRNRMYESGILDHAPYNLDIIFSIHLYAKIQ